MPRQREWEWQWDKLRLFYERLVSEDKGALVDGEEDLEEVVGHQVVEEAPGGLRRRWVEEWVEVGHHRHPGPEQWQSDNRGGQQSEMGLTRRLRLQVETQRLHRHRRLPHRPWLRSHRPHHRPRLRTP